MAGMQPTEPLHPDQHPTAVIRRPYGCVHGHDQPNNPTWHPKWGLVPAATSVVIGALIIAIVLALEIWLLPQFIPWTVALIALGLLVSFVVQLWAGHRGQCLRIRTLRWWLGPIGSLFDPIEAG